MNRSFNQHSVLLAPLLLLLGSFAALLESGDSAGSSLTPGNLVRVLLVSASVQVPADTVQAPALVCASGSSAAEPSCKAELAKSAQGAAEERSVELPDGASMTSSRRSTRESSARFHKLLPGVAF